jgi:dienelactone hydrolase
MKCIICQGKYTSLILWIFIISTAIGTLTTSCFAVNESLPLLPKNYGEKVVRIPMLEQPSMNLEATIFKPPGNGPFPVMVVNHGKQTNPDASAQERFRPLTVVREFLIRGYVVIAPNRRGFAGSDGSYILRNCDVAADGLRQAEDVHSTVAYILQQPYVDAHRILIAGGSQGGLVTIAYGTHPDAGVRGLINFNGGSRQVKCENWGQNIVNAYVNYGRSSHLPSLWIYGQNDRFWSPELIRKMFNAYRMAGGPAEFADIGTFKNDSHEIEGDPDGIAVWWSSVEAFLKQLGFPTKVLYRSPEEILMASHYAAIDRVDAVPYLDEKGRKGYRDFLMHGNPRVFALSDQGKWSSAVGGDDPLGRAMAGCQKYSKHPCRLYAINDNVVWTKAASSSPFTSVESSEPPVSFGTHTRSSNSTAPAHGYGSEKLLVKPGDTIDDVKKAYHPVTEPEPMESVTAGATGLQLQDMGIWFFFDRDGKIYTIRVESPFPGSIQGVRIGDSSTKVLKTLGKPDPKKPGRSTGHFYYPDQGLHLLFDDAGVVKAIFLNKKTSGKVAGSLMSSMRSPE